MKENSKIILYTIHCPQCKVLEKKLEISDIHYDLVDDIDTIKSKGFKSAPILVVDDKVLNFKEAINWVKEHA